MEAPEAELKFELSDDMLPKLAEHPAFAAPAETSRLRSVYFDTPAQDLWHACLGLRVRESDGGRVQTVKSEKAAAAVRREWEAKITGERPDAAALADSPAAKVLNGHDDELAAVFATDVERVRRLWTRGDDVVEISLDHGEITAGARREPIHELELELKAGDPQALFDLAAALSGQVKLPLLFQSKAERGYQMAADSGWAPQGAEPTAIAPETPAADAFRDIARSCLAQVANNARLLRRYRSLEALHQMRVGLRRFRAALTTFRPMIEDGEYQRLKTETKWLAGELDAARDLDVFIHDSFRCARPRLADREAFACLGADLLRAQSRAYDRALAAQASPRFIDLLMTAARWLEIGDWLRSEEPVLKRLRERPTDAFASDQLDRMHRQVRKRGRRLDRMDPQRRHQLRIKAKKLRYAAEFFAGSFDRTRSTRRFLAALEDLQDGLGRLNDIVVAGELALHQVRGRPAEAGFAAGLIVADRRASEKRSAKGALKAYEDFAAAQLFWR
jgi:inorganic triphosphatase YgiF